MELLKDIASGKCKNGHGRTARINQVAASLCRNEFYALGIPYSRESGGHMPTSLDRPVDDFVPSEVENTSDAEVAILVPY